MGKAADIKDEKISTNPLSVPGGNRSTEEIRSDIERTRAEMSDTIDAIQEKLSPDVLKEQMRDKMREATIGRIKKMTRTAGSRMKDTGSSIVDTIKQNPVPAAMVGIGLGWLMLKGREKGHEEVPRYYRRPSSRDEEIHEEESELSARAADVQAKAKESMQKVQEKAGQMMSTTREKAQQVKSTVQERASQVKGKMQQVIQENPFAIGAAALALGAMVGLSIPESRKEHELMGEAKEKFQEKAGELAEQATSKVKQTLEGSAPSPSA